MTNNQTINQRQWDTILELFPQNMDIILKGKTIKNITFRKEIRNEISFADCQLENCRFIDIDLYNVDFSNAIMRNVTIKNCINIKFESITKLEVNYSKRSNQNQNEFTKTKTKPATTKTKKKIPNLISKDTPVGYTAVIETLPKRKPKI